MYNNNHNIIYNIYIILYILHPSLPTLVHAGMWSNRGNRGNPCDACRQGSLMGNGLSRDAAIFPSRDSKFLFRCLLVVTRVTPVTSHAF